MRKERKLAELFDKGSQVPYTFKNTSLSVVMIPSEPIDVSSFIILRHESFLVRIKPKSALLRSLLKLHPQINTVVQKIKVPKPVLLRLVF